MGHGGFESKSIIYEALADRLNKNYMGTPINEDLMKILHSLFTETEARMASKLPLKPSTISEIASICDLKQEEAQNLAVEMAKKGLLVERKKEKQYVYFLPPMIIGFFEFTYMRVQKHIDYKELTELFLKYLSNEDMIGELSGSQTKLMRNVIDSYSEQFIVNSQVMDYESIREIIKKSKGGAIQMCTCRHVMEHAGQKCKNTPTMEVCVSLGWFGEYIANRGLGRKASVEELLDLLDKTEEWGLVHLVDNYMEEPVYWCNCCSCCCLLLTTVKEMQDNTVSNFTPSQFLPSIIEEKCNGCGKCAKFCPIDAIIIETEKQGKHTPRINYNVCIGCGICCKHCEQEAIKLIRRDRPFDIPKNADEMENRIAKDKNRSLS